MDGLTDSIAPLLAASVIPLVKAVPDLIEWIRTKLTIRSGKGPVRERLDALKTYYELAALVRENQLEPALLDETSTLLRLKQANGETAGTKPLSIREALRFGSLGIITFVCLFGGYQVLRLWASEVATPSLLLFLLFLPYALAILGSIFILHRFRYGTKWSAVFYGFFSALIVYLVAILIVLYISPAIA